MRTGPLVRRGANVSRMVQGAPATQRGAALPRPAASQLANFTSFSLLAPTPIIESSCLHIECKLPINLRHFLAEKFGTGLDCGNEAILRLAADADPATLSRVARAIRRYSTNRAREAWAECATTVAEFEKAGTAAAPQAILCLTCVCMVFGPGSRDAHRAPRCLAIDFSLACIAKADSSRGAVSPIPDRLQRQIEEFRTLRAAFGLSHFDLDCYVTSRRVMFSWRPINGEAAIPHA
jgi:hypothetical protein